MTSTQSSDKSYVVAWVYAMFFGLFGADRFYLGKPVQGILKFLTFGGLGAWQLFNLVSILAGYEKGPDGLPLKGATEHTVTLWIVTAGLWLIQFFGAVLLLSSLTAGELGNLFFQLFI